MTVAACTNCGNLKLGALCDCPRCGSTGLDSELSILLSDHYLDERELAKIGKTISRIRSLQLDEEASYHLLSYFLARKWPKLLEYDLSGVDRDLQNKVEEWYRTHLRYLDGQEDSSLRISEVKKGRWALASTPESQAQDDEWQSTAWEIVLPASCLANSLEDLTVQAGVGNTKQQIAHWFKSLTHAPDYGRIEAEVAVLIGDAKDYTSQIEKYCNSVQNSWSDRTKQQAAYLRGLAQRLEETAAYAKRIVEHKSGTEPLIQLDYLRACQEFEFSLRMFRNLAEAVSHPRRISPDGSLH